MICRCMKLASRSAIESDSSANSGSKTSRGRGPLLDLPDSRREEREDARRGVVGRESGRRVAELERLVLLPAWGVVEDDMLAAGVSLALQHVSWRDR
jgi:hypothetical protein